MIFITNKFVNADKPVDRKPPIIVAVFQKRAGFCRAAKLLAYRAVFVIVSGSEGRTGGNAFEAS